jgi:hypothetical protein
MAVSFVFEDPFLDADTLSADSVLSRGYPGNPRNIPQILVIGTLDIQRAGNRP